MPATVLPALLMNDLLHRQQVLVLCATAVNVGWLYVEGTLTNVVAGPTMPLHRARRRCGKSGRRFVGFAWSD